jgi:hypothetical protein
MLFKRAAATSAAIVALGFGGAMTVSTMASAATTQPAAVQSVHAVQVHEHSRDWCGHWPYVYWCDHHGGFGDFDHHHGGFGDFDHHHGGFGDHDHGDRGDFGHHDHHHR